MVRWICDATKFDKIMSERIRGTIKVVKISSKAQLRRLQWQSHDERTGITLEKSNGHGGLGQLEQKQTKEKMDSQCLGRPERERED